mmetsp:Transcript_44714/g.112100  ORF Transcript_44714/g.112100 Transcript_44714/m.112100 type:complete len:152 (-) Transcript_44714:145-600(-)|eukprot:CAMPEP_0173460542 /NCGR_PEP_ID=MMETSP1357-20121228/63329_1 /TAXON_ID=77926 /ORGANISM="Hemiselmis rufescens, Strain PCC563" /LENGTH=151 /DNA_ID=CAMNT_0014428111 /DNA_START=73 /DNA_END=528 /DNA_ORIENTATION=-
MNYRSSKRKLALYIGVGVAAAGAVYWWYCQRSRDEEEAANRSTGGEWDPVIVEHPLSPEVRQVSGQATALLDDLFSKEALLQPLKEKKRLYHDYLRRNNAVLSQPVRDRYNVQLGIITDLCSTLERDSSDSGRILQLMDKLQQAGEPPALA